MADRNNPCMRNSQSLKSWGSICGNSESVSAAIGGPMQGLMCEHVLGQVVCLCVSVCMRVWVWVCERERHGQRQDGWSDNSVLG